MLHEFQFSRVCVCLTVLLGVIGWAGWATADLVPNGGFDTDLSSWTAQEGWGWFNAADSGSPDGPAAIYINGGADGWLYQPGCTTGPAFVAGQTYELSFLAAAVNAGTILRADITTGSGLHTAYITLTNSYQQYSVPFTATAADVGQPFQPAFLGPAGAIVGVDSVRLNLVGVPEPSALVLLGAGLFGLLAYAWRKRR